MAQVELKVKKRPQVGGRRPRSLRRSGQIPAVVYGGKQGSVPLSIDRIYLEKQVGPLYENQLISLQVEGEDRKDSWVAIVKELQADHLKGGLLHVDFKEVALSEKLTATVPVEAVKEPIGVTRDGGILEHVLREIEVRCLPTQIPERIPVDVSSLAIGDSFRVSDIELEEGVEVLTDPEVIIFTVAAPRVEEEVVEEEGEAAEAAAEGEAGEDKKVEGGGEKEEGDKGRSD